MLALLSLALMPATAATYDIDASHTYVGFKVQHMMVSYVRGGFEDEAGTFTWDPQKPESFTANVTIPVATIDTRNTQRDDHLKGADFFDAANHASITFVAKSSKKKGDGLEIVGDITIRGVTKPITLTASMPSKEYVDPWGNTKIGFTASGMVKRTDFGLNWNKALEAGGVVVGDEVWLEIEVEGAKKK